MGMGAKCKRNQGNARGTYGSRCSDREMQGNVREWVQYASGTQGNAGEYQGNVWERVQSARRMQGNARGM